MPDISGMEIGMITIILELTGSSASLRAVTVSAEHIILNSSYPCILMSTVYDHEV